MARTVAAGPATTPRRADLGRMVMVPLAGLLLLIDLTSLVRESGHGGVTGVLRWLGTGLICVFYSLVIWCYLRRGPAVATSKSISAHVAAMIATWMPLVFPLLRGAPPGAARAAAADLLLVCGAAWAVWSLRSLGRNLSVIPQARGVSEHGPYRFVRHPLYIGEIVAAFGLALTAGSAVAFGCWLVLIGLQVYRARREEQVLLAALPGYASYRSRTAALLPGVF